VSKSIIILPRDDGFCSRLEGLFTLRWSLEKYPERSIVLVWPINKTCRIKFEKIFQVPDRVKVLIVDKEWKGDSLDPLIVKACEERALRKREGVYIDGEFCHPSNILKTFDRKETNIRNKIKINYIRSLNFTSDFKKLIAETKNKYKIDSQTIGIHIRSLETPKYYQVPKSQLSGEKRINKLINYYSFEIKKIIRYTSNQKFLIASDDKNIVLKFKKWFPDNVIEAPGKCPDHDVSDSYTGDGKDKIFNRDEESVLDAMILVSIMSEINYNNKIKIDGSYGFFTKMPWILKPVNVVEQFSKKHQDYWIQDEVFKTLYLAAKEEVC
jgi:hypothetical protein